MIPADMALLEKRMGYTFRNPALLRQALTHSSYANENKRGRECCNERLEFLGDSVLSLIVCQDLYQRFPELPEGKLTVLRKSAVCQRALSEYGMQLGLGNFMLLGKGEERDGREKPKLLEDTFESLLGALYLDCGDLSRVAQFLLPFVRKELETIRETQLSFEDYKTRLQQYVQQMPGEELHYETVGEEGPDNAKTFTVEVFINSNVFGTGTGNSKKEAEQNAAREALKHYLPKQ